MFDSMTAVACAQQWGVAMTCCSKDPASPKHPNYNGKMPQFSISNSNMTHAFVTGFVSQLGCRPQRGVQHHETAHALTSQPTWRDSLSKLDVQHTSLHNNGYVPTSSLLAV